LKSYCKLAFNALGQSDDNVKTRKGLTDALFSFYDAELPKFMEKEREIIEKRLEWIQKE